MGREPGRQRQHFYFCVALLIFVSGCGLTQEAARRREIRESLSAADSLLARGDFAGSLSAFKKVSEAARDKPPADRASYSMGLVYAHPQNPERDLRQAKSYMDRVVKVFPDSPWAAEAAIWAGVLSDAEGAKREAEKARREAQSAADEAEQSQLALERMKQDLDRARLELEKTRQEIEKNKQMIEKAKKVDIEIDQKRRERGR